MTRPQPQYLRGIPRDRARRLLAEFPRWTAVRIRGSEPREIRSVEQLLEWLDAYRVKVVEKLVDDLNEATAAARDYSNKCDALARGIVAKGLVVEDVLAADPHVEARVRADAAGESSTHVLDSGRDRAAGPDA